MNIIVNHPRMNKTYNIEVLPTTTILELMNEFRS